MAKVNLNILIDAELKARIKALAEQENRTLSNLVETELKRVAATSQGEERLPARKPFLSRSSSYYR